VGFLICSVGLKFINTAVLYSVLSTQAWLAAAEAYCGLLSLCCGPKNLWEICVVAYSPVYFRLK
jgi:hypothetical protein